MIVGLLAALGAIACEVTNSPTTATNIQCKIVFSGALTTTHDCMTTIFGTWTTSTDSASINGGIQGTPALAVNILRKGVPVTGTFKQSDAGAKGFVSASSGANGWYGGTAFVGQAAQGSYTMVITGVAEASTTSTGKTYTLHGTIDAVMPSASGGGAALTAQITF